MDKNLLISLQEKEDVLDKAAESRQYIVNVISQYYYYRIIGKYSDSQGGKPTGIVDARSHPFCDLFCVLHFHKISPSNLQ